MRCTTFGSGFRFWFFSGDLGVERFLCLALKFCRQVVRGYRCFSDSIDREIIYPSAKIMLIFNRLYLSI